MPGSRQHRSITPLTIAPPGRKGRSPSSAQKTARKLLRRSILSVGPPLLVIFVPSAATQTRWTPPAPASVFHRWAYCSNRGGGGGPRGSTPFETTLSDRCAPPENQAGALYTSLQLASTWRKGMYDLTRRSGVTLLPEFKVLPTAHQQ